jgi:hypothetical protein
LFSFPHPFPKETSVWVKSPWAILHWRFSKLQPMRLLEIVKLGSRPYTKAQSKLLLILHGNLHDINLMPKYWAGPNELDQGFAWPQFLSLDPIVSNLSMLLDQAHLSLLLNQAQLLTQVTFQLGLLTNGLGPNVKWP